MARRPPPRRAGVDPAPKALPPLKIDFQLEPTTYEFIQSDAKVKGIRGPYGSGKSSVCVMDILKRATSINPCLDGKKRSRWVVVRNTFRQLEDTTIKTWLEWFPEAYFGPINIQRMSHTIHMEGCYIEVLFRALDRPDDVKKVKSLDITGGWINEAKEVPLELVNAVEARCGRYPRKIDMGGQEFWHGLIMDTNPPDEDHWWYNLAEVVSPFLGKLAEKLPEITEWRKAIQTLAETPHPMTGNPLISGIDPKKYKTEESAEKAYRRIVAKYAFFRQPSGLSPEAENLKNLPEGYYEDMAIGKEPEWINVFVHGNYGAVVQGKPVYPEYRDHLHFNSRLQEPPKGVKILRGWDFGRTPTCLLAYLTHDGQLRVFDEVCSKDMGIDALSDHVLTHCAANYPGRKYVDYGDPAGTTKSQNDEKSCFMILWGKGIEIEPGVQTWTLRRESVAKLLRDHSGPGLQIGPKCRNLRQGFLGKYHYRRLQVSAEMYKDMPDKTHPWSDVHDCLQYIATKLFAQDLIDPTVRREVEEEARDDFDDDFEEAGRSAVTGY